VYILLQLTEHKASRLYYCQQGNALKLQTVFELIIQL
jgi:hypothetical protein